MDVRAYNREAWDRLVEGGDEWTVPVTPERIADARRGVWSILLTETKPVPRDWFPEDLTGKDVLCLASGGGQQGPILAAAGARVTVLDNSPGQLAQDRLVADREGLEIATVEGDMADLSPFADESFDLIFHPVSNIFAPVLAPIWSGAFRILRSGGALLAGFMNPVMYCFDLQKADRGEFVLANTLPYADVDHPETRDRMIAENVPLEFSHSLTEQIGGQIEVGFAITGFYEDAHRHFPLARYFPTYFATRAVKP